MRTRETLAAGLFVAALASGAPAFAQGNPNAPPPGGSAEGVIPGPPPADRPLITTLPRPALSIEGGAGVLGYLGGAGRLGPAWNVRVTGEFTPHWALEGNYIGAANARSDDTGTLTYTTLDAGARYNILRADQAPVQPYVVAGLGWAGWFGPGGTALSLVLPVSVGAERLLTEHIKIGARLDVRPALFANLGHGDEPNPPGGSTWALLVNAGGAF
jgi:hypothetical protein